MSVRWGMSTELVMHKPLARDDSESSAALANLYSVFVLSSVMFDGLGADSILGLAANAVPSLCTCQTEATYRVANGSLTDGWQPDRPLDRELDFVVAANLGTDQAIILADNQWRYAITLRAVKGVKGVLVIRAPDVVPVDELCLLKVLAQQAAAAMTSAELLTQDREERDHLFHRLGATAAQAALRVLHRVRRRRKQQ